MPYNIGFEVGKLAGHTVVQINSVSMSFFTDQVAATILKEVETMPIDGYLKTKPAEGVGGELAKRFDWDGAGFVNSLLDQVSFVYAYVKYLVENTKHLPLPNGAELQLYADALQAFQDWKTRLVKAEKDIHGPVWGDAMDFNRAVWTDLNYKLLVLR